MDLSFLYGHISFSAICNNVIKSNRGISIVKGCDVMCRYIAHVRQLALLLITKYTFIIMLLSKINHYIYILLYYNKVASN